MSFRHKLVLLVVVIVAVLLTPYFIWHDEMDAYFGKPIHAWLEDGALAIKTLD